jgi:hypothetical protein
MDRLRVPVKTAAELGLTEEELASQCRLADKLIEELFCEESIVEALTVLLRWFSMRAN